MRRTGQGRAGEDDGEDEENKWGRSSCACRIIPFCCYVRTALSRVRITAIRSEPKIIQGNNEPISLSQAWLTCVADTISLLPPHSRDEKLNTTHSVKRS